MHYFTTLFSLVLIALSVISAHARVCDNRTVIESTPLTLPSGDVITMERFNCADTAANQTSNIKDRRHSFDLKPKRAASQCTTNNCVCGVACVFKSCRAVTQTIIGTDCTQLATQLTNTPGTFTIPANEGVGFILQSCEYTAFVSSATEATEYCFDDMGAAATELFAVCGAQQADCGGSNSENGFFVDQISL